MQDNSRDNPGITAERLAKPDIHSETNDAGEVIARSFAYPLAYYQRAGHISKAQEATGNRYASIWRNGTIRSRFAQSKYDERNDGDIVVGYSDECAIEYVAATNAVRSLAHRKIAYSVCCVGEMAGRGNMRLLREALDDLRMFFKEQQK